MSRSAAASKGPSVIAEQIAAPFSDSGDGDQADTGMCMKFDQFRFSEPALSLIVNRQKMSLFRWLTRKVPPLFLCGGDVMTTGPMVTGYHEPGRAERACFPRSVWLRSGTDRCWGKCRSDDLSLPVAVP